MWPGGADEDRQGSGFLPASERMEREDESQRRERYGEVEDKEKKHLLVQHSPTRKTFNLCVSVCECLCKHSSGYQLSEDPSRCSCRAESS